MKMFKKPVTKKQAEERLDFPIEKMWSLLGLLLPAIMVMVVVLVAYYAGSLYPFGENSVSWCDMSQQQLPLMIDFKDILDGKSSMFLNFENAGGMSFWGVFFFFLASPFTFLVKFVDKENVILFANVLVMLKMMTSAFTAMVYFRKCHKQLDTTIAIVLSFMYGVCGYGMVFFQNIIWLDMMALLPLLLMSLNMLVKEKKVLPYTIVLAAAIIVNYYISYMMIVFILLFMGAYVLMHNKSELKENCVLFLGGSLAGGLISAVVWLPSFIQYLSSARTESILEKIAGSKFIADYYTIYPVLFCTAFVAVVVLLNVFSGGKRSRDTRMYLYLLVLTLIPMVVEPINKMWHTGSYMSFPVRYGFITIFIGIVCCAIFLSEKHEFKGTKHMIISTSISVVVVYIYYLFIGKFGEDNFESLTAYSRTLWGDEASYIGLLEAFIVSAVCYAVIYLFYKKGYMIKYVFVALVCVVAFMETHFNTDVYLTSPAKIRPSEVNSQQVALELADKIEDDSFYRVKTSSKLFHYNLVGSLGYPSLSHYTSLTDQNYMFTMKRLGYTSVWMEMGSCGGTSLTDALLCANYEITNTPDTRETVYQGENYFIQKTDRNTGLGLITSQDLSGCEEIPENLQRAEVQKYLYKNLFGKTDAITKYDSTYSDINYTSGDRYNFNNGTTITYDIYVDGHQRLYFDCFDELTNHLSEPIYETFAVRINDRLISDNYPYDKNNGVLYLGDYADQNVTIKLISKKAISCKSFGVFGINEDALNATLNDTAYVNFTRDKGTLTGSCDANDGETCFLSVPYNDGFTIKVNGESVDYQKVFSSFIAFPLQKGANDIVVTFTPVGFIPGLILTILGVGLVVAYVLYRRKIVIPGIVKTVSLGVVIAAFAATVFAIYIFPLLANILSD